MQTEKTKPVRLYEKTVRVARQIAREDRRTLPATMALLVDAELARRKANRVPPADPGDGAAVNADPLVDAARAADPKTHRRATPLGTLA